MKNDVLLEFHVDDTAGANEKDSLMEISFHIPNTNTKFVGDETRPPAQVFNDNILKVADVGAGVEEAIVTFEGVGTMWSCTFLSYVCKDKGTTLKFNTVVLPLGSASKGKPATHVCCYLSRPTNPERSDPVRLYPTPIL